jgi:hypothetical protein
MVAWSTVKMTSWLAGDPMPLAAVRLIGYLPTLPAAAAPVYAGAALLNDRPEGMVPLSVTVGFGKPVTPTAIATETPTPKFIGGAAKM